MSKDYRIRLASGAHQELETIAAGRPLGEVASELIAQASQQGPGESAETAGVVSLPDSPEVAMSDCVDCKLKDRDLADRDKTIAEREKTIADLNQAHAFGSLPEAVAHAKSGSCPGCKVALEDLAEGMARTTLTELDDKAVLELAIQRGVMPETIKVEMP